MIKLVAAFILGVWYVQRMPILPSVLWLLVVGIASALLLTLTKVLVSRPFNGARYASSALFTYLPKIVAFVASLLLGGVWAAGFATLRMSDALPSAWEREEVAIIGVVADVPEVTPMRERFRFDVEQVLTPDAIIPSHIGLNYYKNSYAFSSKFVSEVSLNNGPPQFRAGERWQITVKLKRPHGTLNPHGFDFGSWALSQNLRATGSVRVKSGMEKLDNLVFTPKYLIERLRGDIKRRIAQSLNHKPYAGVIQALVIGDDSAIDVDVWQVLLKTGVTHLMSISGLHITMLSGLAFAAMYGIWRRVPRLVLYLPARKAAICAGVIVACMYAFVAGFSVPTQRTFYMLMVFGVALWSGRQMSIASVLAIALFVVVLLDPWAVNAAGFWLSFGAVALISFALNGRVGQAHWLASAIKTQWAVTIGMLPMLLIMFNQASVISPVANAIAIPVVSFIVTPLALLGAFLSLDWPLTISYVFLDWLMQALNWMNDLPISTWQQHSPAAWTFWPAMCGALILLLPRGVPLKVLGLAGFVPMVFMVPERPMQGSMKITVLDVGQGLSVHVQTAKHDLIYDTGPRYNNQADAGARIVLPHLHGEGVKTLDGLVVSHDDNDHSGGAGAIVAMMPTKWVMSSYDFPSANADFENVYCVAGKHWEWDGILFEVLYPTQALINDADVKDNNKSCVIKVSNAVGSMLLTGDIQKKAERYILENVNHDLLDSDVMTVPHHGSKTSSSKRFLNAVTPDFSIATAGYLNRFGHPKEVVLERYVALGGRTFQSSIDGAAIIEFNQAKVGGEAEKVITLKTWASMYQRYWLDGVKSQH